MFFETVFKVFGAAISKHPHETSVLILREFCALIYRRTGENFWKRQR